MRWGVVGLASVLLIIGCGDEGTERSRPEDQEAPSPEVEQVAADAPVEGNLQVVGGTLVAQLDDGAGAGTVVRSTDLGASWSPVALPGAPSDMQLWSDALEIVDGVAIVTWVGADASSNGDPVHGPHVWTSRDGTNWHGGRLPSVGPPSFAYGPEVGVVGDRLVAGVVTNLSDQSSGLELFTSDDGGTSWVPADLPAPDIGGSAWIDDIWQPDEGGLVAVVFDESLEDSVWVLKSDDEGESWELGSCPEEAAAEPSTCERLGDSVGSFRLGIEGVSVDGGETWHDPVVEPPPERGEAEYPWFEHAVELSGDRWLASVSFWMDQDMSYGVLVRSEDGVHWQQLLADDPCLADGLVPEFSEPVPLGDGWLVVHSCRDYAPGDSTEVVWADLYVTGADGSEPVEIPGSRQQDAVGDPVAIGEVIVLPVSSGDAVTIMHVRP